LKIHLLEAKTGDAFIVDCGASRFLIDGGTRGVSKTIQRILKKDTSKLLKGIFVSHVDRDHVGGIVKLFEHHQNLISKDVPVYMNHPSLISVKQNDSGLVTFQDGNDLKSLLDSGGYITKGVTSDQVLTFDDVEVGILTPDDILHDSLISSWKKHDEGLVTGTIIDVDCSMNLEEPKLGSSRDIVNSSSISFVLSYQDKRALFLSDSLPEHINKSLATKQKFNVVKVSHHGSKHNTSMALLEKIDCNNFIISTNGPNSYGHPHAETIVRIIRACVSNGYEECNIHFNYKKVYDRINIKNPPSGIKINLIHTKILSI
jgi:beta-lactamase superfamily II metal-dependent hydrolase